MTTLPKPVSTDQSQPETPTEQAAIVALAKEVIDLKKELADQRKENKNFILWVIGGVVAIVAVVAIEIIIFHTRTDKDFLDLHNQYLQEVQNLREKNFEIELRFQREIDAVKIPMQNLPNK